MQRVILLSLRVLFYSLYTELINVLRFFFRVARLFLIVNELSIFSDERLASCVRCFREICNLSWSHFCECCNAVLFWASFGIPGEGRGLDCDSFPLRCTRAKSGFSFSGAMESQCA